MTTAFYYTPSGRCINKPENGIKAKGMKSDDDGDSEDSVTAGKDSSVAKDSVKKDTTTYKTKKGRIVYGGGGIIPDTIVKPKIPEYLLRILFLKDAFFSFANNEYLKLKAGHVKIDKDFVISDAIMTDFRHYLDSTHFKFQNQAQSMFEDFKIRTGIIPDTSEKDSAGKTKHEGSISDINKPKWAPQELESLKKISLQIDNILSEKSKGDFAGNSVEIKKYLRETLLSREFGPENDVVYRAKFAQDVQFQAALDLIADKKTYKRLLEPKSKK
jgi:carboxyl-terminal processing protease